MVRSPLTESALRAKMVEGRAAFRDGDYFSAHELWEEAWNAVPADAPARPWIQGLIQLATALYKLERGRPDLCGRLLEKALSKWDGAGDTVEGVDLAAARRGAEELLAAIREGGQRAKSAGTPEIPL